LHKKPGYEKVSAEILGAGKKGEVVKVFVKRERFGTGCGLKD
jgi:hypothetical protein